MRRGWRAVVQRIPAECAVCRRFPSQTLCEDCIDRLADPPQRLSGRCATCALRVDPGVHLCGACMRHPAPLAACFAAVDYGFPWDDLVGRFKFHGEPGLAVPLAALMSRVGALASAAREVDGLIPIPLSPLRLRERGYNQAHELARRLAPGRSRPELLVRVRETAQQHLLSREERLLNLGNAFAPEPRHAAWLRGRHLALVDDVMTTGATLFEAARTLLDAGAASVAGLVLARASDD